MVYSANKKAYNEKYTKENLHRIPLNVQNSKYKEIQEAAEKAGENVSQYIKKAIDMRMQSEQ